MGLTQPAPLPGRPIPMRPVVIESTPRYVVVAIGPWELEVWAFAVTAANWRWPASGATWRVGVGKA